MIRFRRYGYCVALAQLHEAERRADAFEARCTQLEAANAQLERDLDWHRRHGWAEAE